MDYIIAYDLETGGTKASLYTADGESVASSYTPCSTYYPQQDFREQKPEDWWAMVVRSHQGPLAKSEIDVRAVRAVAIRAQSGVVPLASDGELLIDSVPVWHDARAVKQAEHFFRQVDPDGWYMKNRKRFSGRPFFVCFQDSLVQG